MNTMREALKSAGLTGVSVAQVADLVNQVYDSVEAESNVTEQRKSNAKEETMTAPRQFVLTNPDGPASRRQRMYIAALTKQVNGKGIYITDSLTRAEAAAMIGKLQAKLGVTPNVPGQRTSSNSRADVEALLK